jgi:hypothetical protein
LGIFQFSQSISKIERLTLANPSVPSAIIVTMNLRTNGFPKISLAGSARTKILFRVTSDDILIGWRSDPPSIAFAQQTFRAGFELVLPTKCRSYSDINSESGGPRRCQLRQEEALPENYGFWCRAQRPLWANPSREGTNDAHGSVD